MAEQNGTNTGKCAEEYVVKRGDSFYLIAHKLGVPLRDLLAANRDIHPARLMVGDVLCVPREEDDSPQAGGLGGSGTTQTTQKHRHGSVHRHAPDNPGHRRGLRPPARPRQPRPPARLRPPAWPRPRKPPARPKPPGTTQTTQVTGMAQATGTTQTTQVTGMAQATGTTQTTGATQATGTTQAVQPTCMTRQIAPDTTFLHRGRTVDRAEGADRIRPAAAGW